MNYCISYIIIVDNSVETMNIKFLNDTNTVMRFYSHSTYFLVSEFYPQLCLIFLNLYFHLKNNYNMKLDKFVDYHLISQHDFKDILDQFTKLTISN